MTDGRDREAAVFDSWTYAVRNRDAFLVNNRDAVVRFGELHRSFEDVWRILGTTRDASDRSHAGLLTLIPIFERQLVLGMNNLAMHQSHMAWLALRPGLEALLFVGIWVKDPANAKVWLDWATDRKTFMKTFDGKVLKKTGFPSAADLVSVLTEINNRYAHPNPLYRSHGELVVEGDGFVEVSQSFYDDIRTAEAHLLAFLSLLEVCLITSADFVKTELVITGAPEPPDRRIPGLYDSRAKELRASDLGDVLKSLGLWEWTP